MESQIGSRNPTLLSGYSVARSSYRVIHGPFPGGRLLNRWKKLLDTICPFYGLGCSPAVHAQEGQIVKVGSPLDHSVTPGSLSVKGRFGGSPHRFAKRGLGAWPRNPSGSPHS